jgi:hypothetical protein
LGFFSQEVSTPIKAVVNTKTAVIAVCCFIVECPSCLSRCHMAAEYLRSFVFLLARTGLAGKAARVSKP